MAPAGGAVAGPHDALIAKHSATYGVPETLVRRVIHIESKGNARVVSKGNYGLMQIRLGTAKSMGYRGTADGLLDADTNMTYAVKYLASAYRAAGCNEQRAINYYQRGFYKRPTSKCALPRSTTQIASVERPAGCEAFHDRSRHGARPRPTCCSRGWCRCRRSSGRSPPWCSRPRRRRLRPRRYPVPLLWRAPAAPAPAPASAVVQPAVPPPAAPQTVARAPEPDLSSPPPQNSPALPTVFMELLPMPRPRPAKAPQAVAKLEAATVAPASQNDAVNASPDVQVAKLDSAAVPLPQPKPEIEAAPERESKRARRAPQRHTYARVSRKKPEESGLVTFWKKLTTPEPTSRRRTSSSAR